MAGFPPVQYNGRCKCVWVSLSNIRREIGLCRAPEARTAAGHDRPHIPADTKLRYYRNGGQIMSFRNGDKSREHRLRKQKQQKRESVRKILEKDTAKAESKPAGVAKKPA
jgi:hypothetical protein